METNEKIKAFRKSKGWSQEEMAEKLKMSTSGYANIEQGKTDIQQSRLRQISKVLGIKLSELIDLEEKILQIFTGDENSGTISINTPENQIKLLDLQHKLEKADLEIAYLKEENSRLKEMIELMKKK